MKYQEGLLNTSDGLKLFTRHWQPDSQTKGIVCLTHGLGDHSGLYLHVADFLAQSGYAVLAFDARGHGKSDGKRGHIPSIEAVLEDYHRLVENAHTLHPDLPYFLYGQSFGGNLVLNYMLRYKPKAAGIVCTSPWLRLSSEPPAHMMFFARVMDKLLPSITLKNGLNANDLSHDVAIAKAYTSDSLVHSLISPRFVVSASKAGGWALAHAHELSLPLLLMHGRDDRITSHQASQEFAKAAGELCTFKQWEGSYHELHNETNKLEVLSCIVDWMDACL